MNRSTLRIDGLRAHAPHAVGDLRRAMQRMLRLLAGLLIAAPASADELTGGVWTEVANSNLPYYSGPLAPALHGDGGPTALMGAWNGAAFDTSGNRLIVFGGGHRDYYGNEVYAFSLATMSWTELNLPSDPVGTCSSANNGCTGPTMPDGQPTSVHTYDTPVYVPALHAVFSMAGATNNGYRDYWLFDFAQNRWTTDIVPPAYAVPEFGKVVELDPVSGHLFGMSYGPNGGQTASGLFEYDPIGGTFAQRGQQYLPDYHMTAAIDPVHRRLVAVGGGYVVAVSLTTGTIVQSTTTGIQTVVNGNAPGFVWHAQIGKFVGWSGGSNLYTLDPQTWQWTLVPPSPGSATPTQPNDTGTFGRFQYSGASQRFIVVNHVNQNVYLFNPTYTVVDYLFANGFE